MEETNKPNKRIYIEISENDFIFDYKRLKNSKEEEMSEENEDNENDENSGV